MNSQSGRFVFVGCIILGLGIGMLFDHTGVGVMIGLGVGFIAMALFSRKKESYRI